MYLCPGVSPRGHVSPKNHESVPIFERPGTSREGCFAVGKDTGGGGGRLPETIPHTLQQNKAGMLLPSSRGPRDLARYRWHPCGTSLSAEGRSRVSGQWVSRAFFLRVERKDFVFRCLALSGCSAVCFGLVLKLEFREDYQISICQDHGQQCTATAPSEIYEHMPLM